MGAIPLGTLGTILVVLLVTSGFFSIAETAMMAANRFRLKHRAQQGAHGAKLALSLLSQTDRLLGVILLGNTLVAAAAATLTAVITKRLYGEGELALSLGTLAISFALLIFSEITPKVVGAAHADTLAPLVSYVLSPLLKITQPIVWFTNLFVQGLLKLFRFKPAQDEGDSLTQEELRTLVLEGQYFRGKHRALLANLLEVDSITVDDIMTPRHQLHAIDIAEKPAELAQQIATTHHTRLPVYENDLDNIVGFVNVKQVLPLLQSDNVDAEHLRAIVRPAYFVPAGTPLLQQLQQFQNNRRRIGLVVDEYGELKGLVTIEDIIEEIIGDFTTPSPEAAGTYGRAADGSVAVDGMAPLRTLNRKLGTQFPLDGPKTLNGLIVEHLGEIPDAGTRLALAGQELEILQTQGRAIKVVRLLSPLGGSSAAPPLQGLEGRASSKS
ncbi:MAG: CNNM domain-containing protein [Pseudomonadota bacterium]|nr:CNNM domain-containing protein [Pseudomonadota bacterium]